MIRQRNLKANEKLTFKRTEVNLYYLRNDIDNWYFQVTSLIDTRKTNPSKDVIKKLGIEVVQKLCARRVLKKKDIDEMKFPELPSTPRRSRSASPNRPTTPDSSPRRRSKSIRRVSPKDRHSDCQKKLDFKDDEDGYKVEADTENYYKCRISLLEKQIIKLEKKLQRTATNKDFELLANVYVNKFRDLKNIVDGKHIDGCPKCTLKDGFIQRYIAERNLLKEDKQRLEKMLDIRLTGEKENQYSAYEVLQNKNALETCKHQKKAPEDERNKLQKEKIELENELQSLNSKLEQFDDSARNMSNLKEHINDIEEGYRNAGTNVHEAEEQMQKLKKNVHDQKKENSDLIVQLEYLKKKKKELEDRLRLIGSHYKEELDQKKEEIDKIQRDKEKYMVSKDEMSKFKKDNAEMKQKLQNLSTQLKESEYRLEINNYENSSIIKENKELKNILQEKLSVVKRLETRLQIDNIEKSSVLKENKELKSVKNLLQEKLSEVKRLETSVQQYAETMEYNSDLKRHMDKLQKENDELNQKCTHLQKVGKDVQKLNREKIQLETDNISLRQDNETLNSRLEMLNVEKLEIEDRLRLRDDEVELLFNSLETERQEHESAMKKLEMQYAAVQNEYVELLLKLQKIHNSSEISFEKLNFVIDKDIFGQKLEETTAQENTLAKDTTKILENFASAKDKKGCIEVLKKRFEKSLPKCDNGISSAEKTDMEDNTSNSSCTKYYEETVKERKSTCHNRIHRTTNVTNFNIAGSNVSFNENTQQLSRLNGNNGQYPAIEEGN